MTEKSLDAQDYGWASVQMDGGIQNVVRKMSDWFNAELSRDSVPERMEVGMEGVRIGLMTQSAVSGETAAQFARLTRMIVAGGGTVIVPDNDPLLKNNDYVQSVLVNSDVQATLNYAQPVTLPGFYTMFAPSRQWGEILTGIGAGALNSYSLMSIAQWQGIHYCPYCKSDQLQPPIPTISVIWMRSMIRCRLIGRLTYSI